MTTPYYLGREAQLAEIFGSPVQVLADHLEVGDVRYPLVDDVIITLPLDRLPEGARRRLGATSSAVR